MPQPRFTSRGQFSSQVNFATEPGDTVVAQHMGGNNVLMLSAQVQSLIGVSNFLVAAALAAVVLGIMLAFQVLLWAALRPVGGLNEVFANLRR